MPFYVKSILPRVHWSAEELAEGAFIVGGGNSTKPIPPSALNVTELVVEGVNKTVSTILDVLGKATRDSMTTVITNITQDVLPSPPTTGDGGHPIVPKSEAGPTPSEVGSIMKVVFALFIKPENEK